MSRLSGRVSVCIDEVSMWLKVNIPQLNHAKTEVIWFSSVRRQHQIQLTAVRIGSTSSLPVQSVRDLGVYLNTDVSLTTHVAAVVRSCFASLRQIRSVRRSLPQHGLLTLIRAHVVSKIDYCNSVLTGLTSIQTDRLQSVLNAAARIVYSVRRYDHI